MSVVVRLRAAPWTSRAKFHAPNTGLYWVLTDAMKRVTSPIVPMARPICSASRFFKDSTMRLARGSLLLKMMKRSSPLIRIGNTLSLFLKRGLTTYFTMPVFLSKEAVTGSLAMFSASSGLRPKSSSSAANLSLFLIASGLIGNQNLVFGF